MSPAPHPRMHGLTHVRGGPDPIPGLLTTPAGPGEYEAVILGTDDLLAYWRLGEDSGTSFADLSGNDYHLTLTGSGTAPTLNVTGALEAGDDGALELNYDGTSGSGGRYLDVNPTGTPEPFDLGPPFTFAAWIKIKASALTRRGLVVGNSSNAGYPAGIGLQVIYPSLKIRFSLGDPAGGLTERYAETDTLLTDTWYLAAGTYDGTTISLYIDAVLVDTTSYSHDSSALHSINVGCRVGYGHDFTNFAWLYGMADEVAVWTRDLTPDEIATMYASGVQDFGTGDIPIVGDDGTITWGQVTSDSIQDATIVNADISDTAEIAVSKLAEGASNGQVLKTVAGVPTWSAGGASSGDTYAWMPLTTVSAGVPDLVWDGDDQLIPTLTSI